MGTTLTAPSTTAASTSNCGDPCGTTSATALERTRFFPRQLIGPADLTQDQIYFREKLRRHNRMLHGWGVVCGVGVQTGATSCQVIVGPGYILGPYGDEIVIDQATMFDVCKQSAGQSMGCCGSELDPWCSDVRANCSSGTLYLAVRYQECMARPIQTASCGCGCDDSSCQYSRIRDSFALTVLDALPSSYSTPFVGSGAKGVLPCIDGAGRSCPPCPTSPWVIIADLTVGSDCTVTTIDCFAHRRYVESWGNFYSVCGSALQETTGQLYGSTVPTVSKPIAGLGSASGSTGASLSSGGVTPGGTTPGAATPGGTTPGATTQTGTTPPTGGGAQQTPSGAPPGAP